MLCVSILVDSIESALADALAAKGAGADLVEFRVDRVFDPGADPGSASALRGAQASGAGGGGDLSFKRVERLARETPLPCIVTCRPTSEGGEYDGDEQSRIALFERLGDLGGAAARFLDVELETYARSANIRQKIHLAVANPGALRDLRTSLILSFHDFQGRPADLMRKVARLRAEPAPPEGAVAALKIAFRCRSLRDNLELFDLLAERDRPTIALGMGEFGLMSRILAPKFGGFLTFASLRPTSTTAPGQPTVEEALGLYRFRSIGPATRVYGVIGWPLAHSLSPLAHNAAFADAGHDGVYLPLPIPPEWEHFKATLLALIDHPRLDFSGASVTIPHKEHLLRLATEQGWEIEALAQRIGAANTVVVDRTAGAGGAARVRALNTDAPAGGAALRQAMGWLKGKRIAILGAGGAAAAIATALADEGATVVIHNRTRERAEALCARVRERLTPEARALGGKVVAAAWEKRCGSCCEAFVNCTPLGMHREEDGEARAAGEESPLPPEELERAAPGTVVMDTVYNPVRTPLIVGALERNLPIVDGVTMFARQAEMQSELWTGRAPEPRGFDRLVRSRLS